MMKWQSIHEEGGFFNFPHTKLLNNSLGKTAGFAAAPILACEIIPLLRFYGMF